LQGTYWNSIVVSETRLYLYRKAGREVWDAEMWLPDGCRRVWRTGIADRDAAEKAAGARLEALVASMTTALPVAAASASAAGAAQALGPTLSERFDRWFFGELASLWK
jgi:hypothetical protein